MVYMKSIAFLGLVAASASAAPLVLEKRIAQSIPASTAKWEQACIAAKGGQECNPLSIKAFSTLLAAPGPCAQQDAADDMMDLAKKLNNQQMITLTQIFTQQPRNTPNSVATPYCQKAPRNTELNGLFQCQFQGAKQETFAGGAKLGDAGTIPFGRNAPLSPPGSCPANPAGPIADGTQLVDLTQSPGAPGGNAGGNGGGAGGNKPAEAPVTSAPAPAATPATPAPNTGNGAAGGFKQANGQDAQALNAKFGGLAADSPCTAGENACVKGGFAQCVAGKFVVTQCSGGLICAALPLVNSRGTSITCTTTADAEARIAASGATGGITGSGGAAAPASAPSAPDAPAAPAAGNSNTMATTGATAAPAPAAGGFKQANGQDAQALNAKFSSLSADSPCNAGENACVKGGFAQCVAGKFVVTQCSGGLVCAALPLVNSRGTSITCTTTADAQSRIAASGATGGITGA